MLTLWRDTAHKKRRPEERNRWILIVSKVISAYWMFQLNFLLDLLINIFSAVNWHSPRTLFGRWFYVYKIILSKYLDSTEVKETWLEIFQSNKNLRNIHRIRIIVWNKKNGTASSRNKYFHSSYMKSERLVSQSPVGHLC